ncbi:hypothetical protein GJ744_006459 [Endocarpon pusillum]|uniref:NodB homology domain-containing protein n=1 Tax=Endocarpon pusillum TaxID=364733 RepID=A0A8H7AZ73_9EURO|nr:hypothetical protein GJ744_006459 [Endocarpon pusillum]
MADPHGSCRDDKRSKRLHICLSVDFDAISGYLGTGHDPRNTLADYSAGIFSARVGVPRLLKLFGKYGIGNKVSWFLPGHSIETFPEEAAAIARSGAEIGLHGYSHEGAYAMTLEQEEEVLMRCIEIVVALQGGKLPVGYRAPLYQIRETTVQLLQKNGFLYDSNYSQRASSWMVPSSVPKEPAAGTDEAKNGLLEIPSSWYTEDMTPLGFYPYTPNSQGYVAVDVVERMWWDRFDWLWENECFVDEDGFGSIYPMVWHPESAGRAHVVGMIDRFIGKLVKKMNEAEPGEITFETMETMAKAFKAKKCYNHDGC